MRQGWEGNILATSRLTFEVYSSQFVVPFFLILGTIARVMRLSLPVMYTLARMLGGATLLGFVTLLIFRVYPDSRVKRIVALLFVAFGTYFWGWGSAGPAVAPLVHTWTELDPIFRWSYIPHHLWSKVFFIPILLLLIRPSLSRSRLVSLVCLTIAMGFTSPVVLSIVVPFLFLWMILECVAARGTLQSTNAFLVSSAIVLVTALFVAIYHRGIQGSVFPWTSYTPWENSMRYPITLAAYGESLGPTVIFFIVAIVWLLARPVGRMLLAWAVIPVFMIFVLSPIVPLSNTRYLGGYSFIPIGIGAVQGIWLIAKLGDRFVRTHVLRIFLVVLVLGYSAIGIAASLKEHLGYVAQNRYNTLIWVPSDVIDMIGFIARQKDSDCVVAASYTIGTMVPAFTSCRVVAGHALMTQNQPDKVKALDHFFLFGDSVFAQDFLARYRVTYILVPKSQAPPPALVTQLHLRLQKENSSIVLYRL
ncbi:hypothetical protein A2973_01805 [Candidatus Gottesmanbacteria bacterium RIFCSPLOWO2_01_FULL_49_10]|uniref:Glycosyltransferase RgtA/B/C/D-like domain-containing protein n=1 Tax=Candidatus Gottesmanbacteria bacterium RIFCSPLOWO2_01_FULL_49_10 TaxID=1798396 RepID=A0A1F6B1E0_9BACT|nr:MAG: hypothetical protein A2973_01805 [Candidatus Gottesmanbacteria bacterium RIFCSPLOWO2_01_FULL_49_10]